MASMPKDQKLLLAQTLRLMAEIDGEVCATQDLVGKDVTQKRNIQTRLSERKILPVSVWGQLVAADGRSFLTAQKAHIKVIYLQDEQDYCWFHNSAFY